MPYTLRLTTYYFLQIPCKCTRCMAYWHIVLLMILCFWIEEMGNGNCKNRRLGWETTVIVLEIG